jgi:Tol biopolymer transport system component
LVFTKGPDVFLAKADGSDPHLLASTGGVPSSPGFSPDGSRIRYSVEKANTQSIWEIRADGSGAHQLFSGWHSSPSECCGAWTADGRYYIFTAATGRENNLYALRESAGFLRSASATPAQLTTGPLLYSNPLPSLDGKKVFVVALQQRAELVRYDRVSKQFVPFLEGISASDVAFSRDGKWVTYTTIPDNTLWRSRVDGSERLQLSQSPWVATLPSWSPDGSQIAYIAYQPGKPWKIFVISAQGGSPEELLPQDTDEVDVSWSPDGKRLAFGRLSRAAATNDKNDIELLDLNTRQKTILPGSQGFFSPRWSPDGRYISAVTLDSKHVMLYDFQTQAWSEWLTDNDGINYGGWSWDGRYFVYDTFTPTSRRVKLGEHHPEDLFGMAGLRRYLGVWGFWSGMAPDDSRIFARDASTQEIYALDVELP